MTDVDVSFGAAVYDALRRLSGFDCLTSHLNYAAIQSLKSADREGTARIFAACGPDVAALIASGEPEDVAKRLLEARAARMAQGVFACELLQLLTNFLGA
jgi:2-hydroxychromene-2-carboxylate isomerase